MTHETVSPSMGWKRLDSINAYSGIVYLIHYRAVFFLHHLIGLTDNLIISSSTYRCGSLTANHADLQLKTEIHQKIQVLIETCTFCPHDFFLYCHGC
jgi:hypothetical protein